MEKDMRRPLAHENDPYYTTYIDQVDGVDFMRALQDNLKNTTSFLEELPETIWEHRYKPEKWNVKEVMIHVIDTERIFAYRALRIARNDQTAMAGFDQDAYIPNSEAGSRPIHTIIDEYQAVRNATISMFRNFTGDMLMRTGTASDKPFSTLALAFIIAGHENHHLRIIRERYLV